MHRRITGRLVIATHNPGKLAEMRELLAPYGIEAVSAGELGLREPDETGATFQRQCRDQGAWPRQAPRNCRPSPTIPAWWSMRSTARRASISARWAGEGKDFLAAMTQIERLLQERGAKEPAQRTAHFVSALCLAWPDGHAKKSRRASTARWSGRRAATAGFGYDPMFLPDGHGRTFGEMTSVEKHGLPPRGLGLSHRAQAFVKLAELCL